ncbi:MAG: hypothetical protein L3K05_02240, partial [Thermoplasmata archaeon]|nr:hypothetical protein [Thermoplasmata archaeon]
GLRPRPPLRFDSPTALLAIERRLLRAERRRSQEVRLLAPSRGGILLDTAPFGPATYCAGVAQLDSRYRRVSKAVADRVIADLEERRVVIPERVVYLDAPEAVRRSRSRRSRATHPALLAARHRAVGRVEREFWAALSRGSAGSVQFVRAGDSASAVTKRVLRALARPSPPLRRDIVLRALRALAKGLDSPRNGTVKKGTSSRRPPRR